MAYWATSDALSRLAQSESGGKADLIHYPTGYTKSGTRSSASGLYGYLDSTWQTQAAAAGVDVAQYPRAYMAPADVQTAVAARTPISNWTCKNCNSTAQAIAAEQGTTSATPTLSTSATYDPATDPTGRDYGTGFPEVGSPTVPMTGAPGGSANPATAPGGAPGGGLPQIGTWLKDQGIRLGVMVLGIVLVGIAALALAWGELGGAKGAAATAAKFVK